MLFKNLLSATALAAATQAVKFTVESSGGNATSPYQYGIMFEDINNSGDGGVYAELVQNRAFQGDRLFHKNLWFVQRPVKGSILRDTTDPVVLLYVGFGIQ